MGERVGDDEVICPAEATCCLKIKAYRRGNVASIESITQRRPRKSSEASPWHMTIP